MQLDFENISLIKENGTDYVMFACKDRTCVDGERYVIETLLDEEMRKVFEKLKPYFY